MATVIVRGHGKNEATVVINDEGQVSFECGKGAWCNRQDEIRWEDSMDDAVKCASVHVDRHDEDDLAKVNGPL